MTGYLYNLNWRVKLRALLRRVLINLDITVIAEAILLRISAEQVPFFCIAGLLPGT